MRNKQKYIVIAVSAIICLWFFPSSALAAGNTTGYAWGENIGWVNFNSTDGGVTVASTGLTGYLWLENVGWIHLDYDDVAGAANTTATNWGVTNDGSGNLAGYAYGENIGWVNFHPTDSQVIITGGNFSGYAWGENVGWIKMDHSETGSRPATTWTSGGGGASCGNGTCEAGEDSASCPTDCPAAAASIRRGVILKPGVIFKY